MFGNPEVSDAPLHRNKCYIEGSACILEAGARSITDGSGWPRGLVVTVALWRGLWEPAL